MVPQRQWSTLQSEHLGKEAVGSANPVFPTGQVGQAVAKPGLAYGNSLGPGLARAYRLCNA